MVGEEKIGRELKSLKRTLSVAESLTGGLLSHRLTNVPGSSDYFMAGLVAYSNYTKRRLLKVPASVLIKHGAVSSPVAYCMAQGVSRLFKTDYGIGITGIAGPGGGTLQKPVGLVYIAVASSGKNKLQPLVKKFLFKGTRQQIKHKAVNSAFTLLLKYIKKGKAVPFRGLSPSG